MQLSELIKENAVRLQLAARELRRAGLNNFANYSADNHLPNFKRRNVRPAFAHTPAQIWVD